MLELSQNESEKREHRLELISRRIMTIPEETNNTLLLQNLVQSVATMQRQILELQNSRGQLTVPQSQLYNNQKCRRNLEQDPVPGTSQTQEYQTNVSACNDGLLNPTVPVNHLLRSGQNQQHDSDPETEFQATLDVLPTVAQNTEEHITGKGTLQAAHSDTNLEHVIPQVDRDLLLTTHIPLSTMVKPSLKANIWANKFIDLSLLLTTDQQPSYDLICEPGDFDGTGGPQLKWSQRKSVTIKYINQWTDAFNTFTAVYTERFPEQAPNLMKYMATVRRFAKRRGTGPCMTQNLESYVRFNLIWAGKGYTRNCTKKLGLKLLKHMKTLACERVIPVVVMTGSPLTAPGIYHEITGIMEAI